MAANMDPAPLIPTTRRKVDLIELATFQVGGLTLAIDIRHINDINDNIGIFPVPGAPSAIRGVINLRGDVVTVVDPRYVLHGTTCDLTNESRNIIVESMDENIALLVDRVMDVMSVESSAIESAPANLAGADGTYFSGVIRLDSVLVVVLNVEATLAAVNEAVVGFGM